MRSLSTLTSGAILLADLVVAVPWLEPVATPTGVMAQVGISLLPTQAPGLGNIPKELLRKQADLPFPPPVNWCGFVNGQSDDILSCVATMTCVYSGAVMGCCDAGLIETCTNIYTTCSNYGDSCGSACLQNDNILKCSFSEYPYCGTYAFDSGTRLYNCLSVPYQVYTVESLADYYISAIGETLGYTDGPFPFTDVSETLLPNSLTPSTTLPGPVSVASTANAIHTDAAITNPPVPTHRKKGLSTGALIGIIIGIVAIILAIIIALVAFVCIRRRKRRNNTNATLQHGTPMQQNPPPQQHQQQFANPAYNSLPQQDTQFKPPQQQPNYGNPPPPSPGIMHPPYNTDIKPTASATQTVTSISEPQSPLPPRYSTANTSTVSGGGSGALSPNPTGTVSEMGTNNESYYNRQPLSSPTITDIDGVSRCTTPNANPHIGAAAAHAPVMPHQQSYGFGHQGQGQGQWQGQGQGQWQGQGQGQWQGQGMQGQGYGQVSPMQSFDYGHPHGQGQGQGQGQNFGGGHGTAGIYEVTGSNPTGPPSDVYELGGSHERR
ncbi:hypothetical protein MMC24_007762 [Lignoscripta atroalba]|nr:hypothetical protein [Lignoscripta atroalba]